MNWNEIKIKTPHLQTGEVNLHFYQSTSKNAAVSLKTKRIISIFGRNGSGKTTISNAFLDMKKTEFQNSNLILSSQLFLKTKDNSHIIDTAITLSPNDKQQLFVYNEQFVDQHIKISKDKNLKAIIMLSDNPDLTNKLEKLKKQEKAFLKQQEQANNDYQTFEANDYEYNDKLIKQEIESKLKAAGHWADLGQQIHGLDVKQRLDHKAFTKIQNIDISGGTPEIADKLKSLLSQNITKLTEIRESTELPLFTEPTVDQNPFPKALELLNESIKEPDLHDLEARVMQVFSKKGQTQIDNDRNLFVAPDTDYCPTCFRKLNRSDKAEIVSTIDQVLIQAHTADFKNKLSSIHFFKYEFLDSLLYNVKFPEKVAHYNQAITNYNEMVDAFEKAIATKLDNVFSTSELPAFNNKQLFAEIKKQAHLINKDVQSYNAIFSNQSALTSSAELINMHLAKYDCRQDFHRYELTLKRRSILKQACLQAKNELKKTNQQITTLKATMAHQKIALDQINTMLAHIFMDKNRLSLVEGNNCYRVRSRKEFISLSTICGRKECNRSMLLFFKN